MSNQQVLNNLAILSTFIKAQMETIDGNIFSIAHSPTTSVRDLMAKMNQIENLKRQRADLERKLNNCFTKIQELDRKERYVKRSNMVNLELVPL